MTRPFLGSIMTVLILGAVPAGAVTRVVDPGPTTIHEAMGQSAPGDSIVLRPGTYALSQAVLVRSGVTITSTDGPWSTILDMQYIVRGFILESLPVAPIISGLSFIRAVGPGWEVGGGILSFNSSPEIRNCLFTDSWVMTFEGKGGQGAAIAVLGGAPIIENNAFKA